MWVVKRASTPQVNRILKFTRTQKEKQALTTWLLSAKRI
jgi:hypothetical protein